MESAAVVRNNDILANLDFSVCSAGDAQFHPFSVGQLHGAIIIGGSCMPGDLLVHHCGDLPINMIKIQKVIELPHGAETEEKDYKYRSDCVDQAVTQFFGSQNIPTAEHQGSKCGYQQKQQKKAVVKGEVVDRS